MLKIKSLAFIAILFAVNLVTAQTVTISNPVLTAPYQVATGTVVTFEWDAFGSPPTAFFSQSTAPNIQQNLPPNSAWTQHTNFTGPINGKYYLDLTITNDTWVWAGLSGFIGWQYSTDIHIQTISSYAITSSASLICPTNGSVLFTAPTGTGYSYQWNNINGAISGETASTYTASMAGAYYCIITVGGTPNTTNTINITDYSASFYGSVSGTQITMTADQTFTSYQWYERIGSGATIAISGATANSYTTPISSTETFYSFEGSTASCNVPSSEKLVIDTLFSAPVLVLYTTPNSQGFVCSGTPVSIKSNGNSGTHEWFKNGQSASSGSDSINIWGAYQNGTYTVEVTPAGWPSVAISSSNSVNVSILDLINPDLALTTGNFYDKFCPGDVATMILTDEGYNYTWYVHDTLGIYGPNDMITVPASMVYSHTFSNTVYITIVAEFNGCSEVLTKTLSSYADQNINLSIDNYDQQYLCIDSIVNISVSSWMVADFNNFQWYQLSGTTWNIMPNQTSSTLMVTAPGEYKIEANPIACSAVTASSNSKTIYSYLDREPYIYAHQSTICDGDTTVLQLSGGNNWYAKQWLQSDVNIGSGGYERSYVGMLNNSATDTQEIYNYSSYRVSAKHNSCPNGLKTKSNIVFIKPTLNPKIVQTSNHPFEPMHVIDWDSTVHIIGCDGEPVGLTLNNLNYDVIEWYVQGYMGDDDYALGTLFHTGDTANNTMDAKFVTAVVSKNGCIGQSTPILLDSRVFASPNVTSYNNSEICNPGDSTLMHLSFPGTWVAYQWYLNGTAIVGATNDSIYGNQEGEYVLNAFPADCPTFEYTSGVGPNVKYLYSEILENDTLIYAMPELGYYTYQWFLDGDSIDGDPNRPFILYKDSLVAGVYTVAVSNENCTKISEGYLWDPTGIHNVYSSTLEVYPNPTRDILYISNVEFDQVDFLVVTDLNGRQVIRKNGLSSNHINVSSLESGMYVLTLGLNNGQKRIVKITIN